MEENKTQEKAKIYNFKGNEKTEIFKKQAEAIKDIAVASTMVVLEDNKTHVFAASIGLLQGLKYKGSIKLGLKAGLAAYGTLIVVNTIQNVIRNRDEIKNV